MQVDSLDDIPNVLYAHIEELEEVVYVPVEAVVRIGEQPTVYVSSVESVLARAVDLGPDNGRMVQILGGLEPDEEVLLAPPLVAARGEARQ